MATKKDFVEMSLEIDALKHELHKRAGMAFVKASAKSLKAALKAGLHKKELVLNFERIADEIVKTGDYKIGKR